MAWASLSQAGGTWWRRKILAMTFLLNVLITNALKIELSLIKEPLKVLSLTMKTASYQTSMKPLWVKLPSSSLERATSQSNHLQKPSPKWKKCPKSIRKRNQVMAKMSSCLGISGLNLSGNTNWCKKTTLFWRSTTPRNKMISKPKRCSQRTSLSSSL